MGEADNIRQLLHNLSKDKRVSRYTLMTKQPAPIADAVAVREGLKNKDLAQDIDLKKLTLKVLLWFLGVETGLIFMLSFFQGFSLGGFELKEWSFRILVSATIIQISYMLTIVISYLFPKK